jgi:hypothetical protein
VNYADLVRVLVGSNRTAADGSGRWAPPETMGKDGSPPSTTDISLSRFSLLSNDQNPYYW